MPSSRVAVSKDPFVQSAISPAPPGPLDALGATTWTARESRPVRLAAFLTATRILSTPTVRYTCVSVIGADAFAVVPLVAAPSPQATVYVQGASAGAGSLNATAVWSVSPGRVIRSFPCVTAGVDGPAGRAPGRISAPLSLCTGPGISRRRPPQRPGACANSRAPC